MQDIMLLKLNNFNCNYNVGSSVVNCDIYCNYFQKNSAHISSSHLSDKNVSVKFAPTEDIVIHSCPSIEIVSKVKGRN